MTMESRQPEEAESNSDLVRSAALSSADLWHEILGRLNEVQEGQLKLARAIESLGMIVCDALAVNPQAALGGPATSLPRVPPRVSLAAGPPPQPAVTQLTADGRDPATTQRAVDSLLGSDVFIQAVPTPEMATPGSVTSPRFYVAPVPEESRTVAREPVSSGSWPRGRRVARGLAREAPVMAGPAIVPNLTPAAIDALLAAEFGDSPMGPPSSPPVVPARDGGPLLNTLLGAEFQTLAPVPPPPTMPVSSSPPPPPPAPGPAVGPPRPPAPTASTPTPVPTTAPVAMTATAPAPPVSAPPVSAPPVSAPPAIGHLPGAPTPTSAAPPPPPPPPPLTTQSAPSWSPTVDPRRAAGPRPPLATPPAPPPVAPRPAPSAGTTPLLPPPVPSSAPNPSPGVPQPDGTPNFSVGSNPPPPAEPRRSPREGPAQAPPPPPPPAPFVAGGLSQGSMPSPPEPVATSDDAPPKRGDSAASMATEILSAAPRTPVAEPTEKTGPTMLAEDVTIMAKGRRRRFRLR